MPVLHLDMSFIRSHLPRKKLFNSIARAYATVDSATIVARPPRPPVPILVPDEQDSRTTIDSHVLAALRRPGTSSRSQTGLPELITQYVDRSEHVLDFSLPYEPSPAPNRRTTFDTGAEESAVSIIAHYVCGDDGHKITLCSGFALDGPGRREGESLVLTCAHTLEEASSFLSIYLRFILTCHHR